MIKFFSKRVERKGVPVSNFSENRIRSMFHEMKFKRSIGFLIVVFYGFSCQTTNQNQNLDSGKMDWQEMSEPVENGRWIQPSQDFPAQPIWGHVKGIRVGLAPMPGPRGLIRIYTPYLGHKPEKMMNFFALEPIVKGTGVRGLSELEMSELDSQRGKRFWSAGDSLAVSPQSQSEPVQGKIEELDGIETLTLYVFSEKFESGAKVFVRLRFYADQPYEVEITTYKTDDSAELDHFIVTATMGNFPRLRTLYLESGKVSSLDLWPDYRGDAFTEHQHFPVKDFIKDGAGKAYVLAATDEDDPAETTYAKGTNSHWEYYGEKATQYWYADESIAHLENLVNGRYTYWGGKSPIPGGISFENFELKAPFKQGMTFTFGVDPMTPEAYIKKLNKNYKILRYEKIRKS